MRFTTTSAPARPCLRHRAVVEPDVLADGDAHPGAGDAEERRRLAARHEPALLVEDAVVGEEALAVDADHPAAGADRGRVGQPDPARRRADEADHDGALPGGGGDLLERGHVVGHEPGLEEEVLGRVARDGQLGHDADVGPGRLGRGQRAEDPLHVARQVADDGVELRGGEAQVRHRPRLPARPARARWGPPDAGSPDERGPRACEAWAVQSQRDYVLRTVEERGIRFVQLWFTDVLGTPKGFNITSAELENALDEGMTFDGSAIDGFSRVQEADVLARPDPKTFQLLPWHHDDAQVARVFCDIANLDGTPFEGDPRHALRRTLERARAAGYTFFASPEVEYFYFADADPERGPVTLDSGSYFDLIGGRPDERPAPALGARCSRRWASPSSTPSTRTRAASTRSTCATPTRSPWPTPS